MVVVAQITDTHLFADRDRALYDVPTAESFQAVLGCLQQLDPQPDLLLLTGDLSQDMTPESYQNLCDFLKPLAIPAYWLPGNHDDLVVMERVLDGGLMLPQKSVSLGNWHFLLLNSVIDGQEEGYLSSESLVWLEDELQRNGSKSVVVALHHPPLAITPKWEDSMLQNPTDLFAILDRFPQVKLVLFGHIHQAFEHQREGVFYLGTPSTCKQFDDLPQSLDDFWEIPQPGLRLLELQADGTWKTRIERINYFSTGPN
jgi:3',5'-cyclic-AMP phosphodiesterase